ncbi:ABC transporter substrate-binding protein [Streptomyces tremellae]|uniref:ABC transporter substrate-binding protein n=1 Tax=Streptomyces tremellae TaxID=1124239 RepID=A0ABP7DSB3_9ACTN
MADTAGTADDRRILTVTRTQGDNEALKTGEVKPQGWSFAFEEVPVLVHAFRRMVRGLEFDVSEMALTTYLVAKEHGARFTAVPAFLVRGFHHGAIHYNPARRPSIRSPKDLEGHKVGVSRGYTVTTGVWARAVLQEEYGVDLSTITWVLSGDEHVASYEPPSNVESMPEGATLEQLLADGELAACIGAGADVPGAAPLIPDAEEAGFAALQTRGFYPINHLVVVKDELLRERPELGAEVFDAFARAKRLYVDRLRAGAIENPTATDRMYARVLETTGEDPLPYGIAPNRAVLETLMRHAVDQRILRRPAALEDVFAKTTLDVTG